MTKEYIVNELKQDQKDGNGEILSSEKEGVLYFDYNNDTETFYRFGKYCTEDVLASKIVIGSKAKEIGLNEQKIAKMIFAAYGKEAKDAICTLNQIGIFFGEEDFDEVLNKLNENLMTGEDLSEWMEYHAFENLLGQMYFALQMPMICIDSICKGSMEIAKDDEEFWCEDYETRFKEIFDDAIGTTIIHELRHCMMDTNLFLPEDKYPYEEAKEENVEEFGKNNYRENVPMEYRIDTNYIAPKDFMTDFEKDEVA
jgi:hypothetical protein